MNGVTQMEAFVLRQIRDPADAVWEPDWLQSAPVKAALLAAFDRARDACHAAASPRSSATALCDCEAALAAATALVRQLSWCHAAAVYAQLTAQGLTLRLDGARLLASPKEKLTPHAQRLLAQWKRPLAALLNEARSEVECGGEPRILKVMGRCS